MPQIRPIPAITFTTPSGDVSSLIAPPYDVLDQRDKDALLAKNNSNIVGVDLPHLPAKTVGPDSTYEAAGKKYRDWLAKGVLGRRARPALFVYQQTYTVSGGASGGVGKKLQRRGLVANVTVQPFGKSASGKGGIHPHEQTFSGPKEDRMKLMLATQAQLSPIFGLHSDPTNRIGPLLAGVIDRSPPVLRGTTSNDGVLHEMWAVDDEFRQQPLIEAFDGADIFIADGHHRYSTALNYRNKLVAERGDAGLPENHPANHCLFVLVALQDPGLIILPTHRVLGGMNGLTMAKLREASGSLLEFTPFAGDLAALEAALPKSGPHAMGLYMPSNTEQPLWIVRPTQADPLASRFSQQSKAWRELDVAIIQHLIVEEVCQKHLTDPAVNGGQVQWKFPHTLDELKANTETPGYQFGLIVQATPLESVRLVSEAGELMPQKSTFFYPKLATGMVINPLD
jgi:uncharacterized protein (DUF1015 family)